METSAKTAMNVNDIFLAIGEIFLVASINIFNRRAPFFNLVEFQQRNYRLPSQAAATKALASTWRNRIKKVRVVAAANDEQR